MFDFLLLLSRALNSIFQYRERDSVSVIRKKIKRKKETGLVRIFNLILKHEIIYLLLK